jgi:hypothetical protein
MEVEIISCKIYMIMELFLDIVGFKEQMNISIYSYLMSIWSLLAMWNSAKPKLI